VDELLRLNPGRQVVVRTSSGPTGEQAVHCRHWCNLQPICFSHPNPGLIIFHGFSAFALKALFTLGYPQPPQAAAILLASGSDIIRVESARPARRLSGPAVA